MKTSHLTFIIAVALCSATTNAQIIDQQYVEKVTGAVSTDLPGQMGQSFTPTLSAMDFFRLNIKDGAVNGDGATIQIRIHSGSGFEGPVLGSTSLSLPDLWGYPSYEYGGKVAEFKFSSPITLTPGEIYTAEFLKISGDQFFIYATYYGGSGGAPTTYTRGEAFLPGIQPTLPWDFYFQEGVYVTSVESEDELYPDFRLFQNYPNPFNPITKIRYLLPRSSFITLKVYDVLGKEVSTLVNQHKNAGEYEVEFNAPHLPGGVYFYKLSSGKYTKTKKLLFLK